jgi:AcrR family transcriptional regulator
MSTCGYDGRMRAPYHHGSLRAELLARAEVALAADGVEALSLRQLARDLGVSHGAPARHFRDKQALLDALALQGFQTLDAAMRAAALSAGSHRERFAAASRAYVDFALDHGELLQVMYTTKHHEGASVELRETGGSSMNVVRELLREAQEAGTIAPGSVDALAYVAFASVHGVAALASGSLLGDIPVDAALAATVDVVWRGMVTPTEHAQS